MKVNPEKVSPLENLLDPSTDLTGITQDMLVSVLEPAIRYRKEVGIVLGKAALVQERLKDHTTLREFAKDLGMTEKTLSSYKSVLKRLEGLTIPEDFSFSIWRMISEQPDPKKVLDHILKEGLSASEVWHLLYKEKGEHKTIICPRCSQEISL